MKYKALSIAGFDGSGGAGIQADLKTFSALGCYGMNVLTSLPVQNTQGVRSVYDIPLSCIEEQMHAIFDDIKVDAIKIGMLHKVEIIETIVSILKSRVRCPIVVDPVIISKSGHRLLEECALQSLKSELIPISTIITPNIPEAEELLNIKIISYNDMENAAKELLKLGCKAVLVKGGHFTDELSRDVLASKERIRWYESVRIKTKNTHGTGCTLSSAIAAYLARGLSAEQSVEKAKIYLTQAIQAAAQEKLGHGCGPVYHFYNLPDLGLDHD
jgi:hydroxymethylpyrimidine/phosphomethylpyrimidine kinase